MNALGMVQDMIKEPIRKSTLGYFEHRLTGHLYEGPCHLTSDDGKCKLRIMNETTQQWEFLDLVDLRHLEKIRGIYLSKETHEWKPIPDDPNELSKLEKNLYTYDFSTKAYIPLDISGNLENVKLYER